MIVWFWGCRENHTLLQKPPVQSIDVFVPQKHVDSGQPITLQVEVYQDHGWRHEALLVSSATLSAKWQDTKIEDLGSGLKSTYQYQLSGSDGSHIINSISLVGIGDNHTEEQKTTEVFVDIGLTSSPIELEDISTREDSNFLWLGLVAVGLGVFITWYFLRRKKVSQPPPTLEEVYRSKWGIFIQKENDAQKRAIMLSVILREYLSQRFSVDFLHATPMEAMTRVQKQKWPSPVKEAVMQIFSETDLIRFAGKEGTEDVFLALGRSLEVVFSVGNTP